MAFIFTFYLFLFLLVLFVIYLVIDYYRVRRKLLEVPQKLEHELAEKIKTQQNQEVKLSILLKTQKNMAGKVLEIEQNLMRLKGDQAASELDQHTFKMMELNTKFAIEQINKSMNFIQEMKSHEN